MTTTTPHPVVVARLLHPDDANVAGNVHGGTTLRLMEEAGMIAATRHIAAAAAAAAASSVEGGGDDDDDDDASASASNNNNNAVAALVRFENMSFHQPLYVGEVASVSARPIFTSEHSILIQVVVTGENVVKRKTRVTNTGELWYVALVQQSSNVENSHEKSRPTVIKMPPISPPVGDEKALKDYERAKLSYEARKMKETNSQNPSNSSNNSTETTCLGVVDCLCSTCRQKYVLPSSSESARSPAESEQSLCQVVLPGDCSKNKIAFGGFVMKLMDNAAGCSAFRHCRTNVVTVAISSINFVSLVRLGDVCTIHSKVVFCSTKTLEIEVQATVMSAFTIVKNDNKDTVVAFGRFTFASLNDKRKAIAVPPLKLESEEDMERAFEGQKRYIMAKKARAAEPSKKSNKTK